MSFRRRGRLRSDGKSTEGGNQMSSTLTGTSTQTATVFVKASAEEIWQAITDPVLTSRYGYGGGLEIDLRPGGSYRTLATEEMKRYGMPEVVVDGEILEVDAPRRLVETWQAHFDPEIEAEPVGRVTWELEPAPTTMLPKGGVTKVTLTHELEDAPRTAGIVGGAIVEAGGGWAFVLSDLKTLLETGSSFNGS
jgi:uncharacterized protein YndB with AHSA1/START domain